MDNGGANPTRQPAGAKQEIECKVLVLATGAMGNAPILMRSQHDLPALSTQVGQAPRRQRRPRRGDRVRPGQGPRACSACPATRDFYKGKPITTMTYDFWVGRRDHSYDGTRFNLQEIFLSSLTNFLYDDGRDPPGDPSWWGLQKKQAVAHWANRIELLAMVEDTHDGSSTPRRRPGGGGAPERRAGRGRARSTTRCPSSRVRGARGGQRGDEADRRAPRARAVHGADRDPGRLRRRIRSAAAAWRSRPTSASTDDTGAVFGYEGLFCIDSSIIPTSLGVNPSLTIAAVSERAADALVDPRRRPRAAGAAGGLPPGHPERDRGRAGGAEAARTGAEEAPEEEATKKKRARRRVRPTARR